jgi:hypothetical protein
MEINCLKGRFINIIIWGAELCRKQNTSIVLMEHKKDQEKSSKLCKGVIKMK